MNKRYMLFVAGLFFFSFVLTACKDEQKQNKPSLEFIQVAVSAYGNTETIGNRDKPFRIDLGDRIGVQGTVISNTQAHLNHMQIIADYDYNYEYKNEVDDEFENNSYDGSSGMETMFKKVISIKEDENQKLKSYNFNFIFNPQDHLPPRRKLQKGLYKAYLYVYDSSGLRKKSDKAIYFVIQ